MFPPMKSIALIILISVISACAEDPKGRNIAMDSKPPFDPELTVEQQNLANSLTPENLSLIDAALLSQSAFQWRKTARVVGSTMMKLSGKYEGIPDVFYSQRVQSLVDSGKLEAQGDLRRMKYSEVRLTK